MNNLSKSRYTFGVRCEKLLWLNINKQNEAEDMGNDAVLENGNKVGDLARHLFGDDYVLIDFDKGYEAMIRDTQLSMKNNKSIICEASFNYDGNFCSVDILKNDGDGVELYEVKSSTEVKDIYIDDITYQTWVLKKCGLNVKRSYLVYVNANYVKNGDFNINEYFNIEDVSSKLKMDEVDDNIMKFKRVVNMEEEPDIDLSIGCHSPYDCPYFKYCTRNLVSPNIFDVGWNVSFKKKLELYKENIISFEEVLLSNKLNDKQNRQIDFYLHNKSPKIDKIAIKSLLNKFKYPLYFLDFESYQESVPMIDGTKPYQQICFQYSLHYYLEEDGKLYHKEYLSREYNGDPMYGLCKQLCEDIPRDSCVLVYNDSFEKTRLKEMASLYPEFSEHLLNIRNNIKDLLPPFRNHEYYTKEMQGSFSIKYVLPALFSDDPSLDYHNLEQVHKGTEATNAYLSLKDLSLEEEEELRKNMLKYCGLDTYAMVKIYEKLKEIE